MASARAWIGDLAASRPCSPVFIPLLEKLAPRINGVSFAAMSGDATSWANSLTQAARLIGADALAIGWDTTLMAEACGAPLRWEDDCPALNDYPVALNPAAKTAGRLSSFLEATRRLCATAKPEGVCVVGLTGVATLASQVFAAGLTKGNLEKIKPFLVEVAEMVCQARPEMLVFVESGQATDGQLSPELRRAYNTLKNVTSYYGVVPALYLEGYRDLGAAAAQWTVVRLDHLFVGADADDVLPDPEGVINAAAAWRSVGVPLRPENLDCVRGRIEAAAAASRNLAKGPSVFFTTAGLVARDADVEALRGVNEIIRNRRH